MKKSFTANLHIALGMAAALATAAPLCAHADTIAPQVLKLRYNAADLDTPAGARRFYAMIKQTADAACGTSDLDSDVMYRHGSSDCVKMAIASTVAHLDNPKLSQVYIEKNGAERAAQFGIAATVLTAKQ